MTPAEINIKIEAHNKEQELFESQLRILAYHIGGCVREAWGAEHYPTFDAMFPQLPEPEQEENRETGKGKNQDKDLEMARAQAAALGHPTD